MGMRRPEKSGSLEKSSHRNNIPKYNFPEPQSLPRGTIVLKTNKIAKIRVFHFI